MLGNRSAPPKAKDINRLIARVLVGKPHATAADIRRLVPELSGASDTYLGQKLKSLANRARILAPAARLSSQWRRGQ